MGAPQPSFNEANLWSVAIRDLRLTIAGTPLEPILAELAGELTRAGVRRLRPRYYLSTEWGVPFETIAVAIPFYLASEELARLHYEQTGLVEGSDRADTLRYLRHEMGHVFNYGYRLYEDEQWVARFGSITQPYVDDFRPQPFSRRHVHHLPGWYAQKHPDEDWAETFAVWMTPDLDWRAEYADWPEALAKLEYCDETVRRLGDQEPKVVDDELDEDVGEIHYSLADYYREAQAGYEDELPAGMDGALRTIFSDLPRIRRSDPPASALLARLEPELVESVYRWTGHAPERTRLLVRHLAYRADELGLSCAAAAEPAATVALTALVSALAMTYIQRGAYMP